ncbi:unnamed protein product [Caenorhabditis bovis]|uniref:Amino acid transporter transmembrane domain-containing protein n=1 Tax=Caenorhabditis bovis TaxID=2654633 RepID=A0A8S1EYW2_9PELO|nr:unnamed protein product [Caenorhabditis bovis]
MGLNRVWSKEQKVGPNSHVNEKGFDWLMGAVFVVGETAGGAMLALPNAMAAMGLVPGVALIVLSAIICTYTGVQLAWTWKIMQNRWRDYREHCRKPYGEMAYRTVGPRCRSFIAFMICVTQIGFACVLLLLAAKNLSIILHYFVGLNINQCYLIVIVGVLIWPMTMLKSPMHFWQVAIFSAGSSSLAVVLIVLGMMHDGPVCARDAPHDDSDFLSAAMAFGTIMFAYGGHATLPTIQHDMMKPAHFVHSVVLSLSVCTLYYLAVGITGYFVYGSTVGEAVIPSIQIPWIQQIVNLMVAVHVISTIVIVMSPPIQQVEQLLHIPHKFGVKRILVRSTLFWLVVFLALSVPHFGPLLDLIGASTMVMMTILLPPIFYLSMRTQEIKWAANGTIEGGGDDEHERATFKEIVQHTPKHILLFNAFILVFGIVGGTLATITSVIKLTQADMAPPCYVQYFSRGGLAFTDGDIGAVNCCGSLRNLTVGGQSPQGYCALSEF